jgi:hypothetical protein
MERNAHRLTLHSPAEEILHLMGKGFIDLAQLKWRFRPARTTKLCKFTTIYCDVTTMQHHLLKPLT